MGDPVSRLGILYEHPEWFAPLFSELDRRALPYDRLDVGAHHFDPAIREVPLTLVLNRMSPSAYLRGHGPAIAYTQEFLQYLAARGVDVINGARAFKLETSKVGQLLLLQRLGLRAPRTRVINHASYAPLAADGLRFPVMVKPNIGGSGAGMQRFETLKSLQGAVEAGTLTLGIDHVALVQEFLQARDGHIVRVEVLDGEFLYAIKVYPNPAAGYNLCPADICQPDGMSMNADVPAQVPVNSETTADLCPVDLPKVALRVEAYIPPGRVIQDVLAIVEAAEIDLGGVEYLVNDGDGEIYYYDINVLSNFVTNAVQVIGFDPYARLVDYLETRGGLRAPTSVLAGRD
jgi:hypothetical protein